MILFQAQIESLDQEILELQRQIEAASQRQNQLIELDTLSDHTLEGLANVVGKIGHYAPDAIAQLKSAILQLFTDGGNNGSDGGNQPTEPTPRPDDSEPELLCLNGLTGDCVTTADNPDDPTHPHEQELNGQAYEWACPLASPLMCLLWEDAPMLEQYCTITLSTTKANENKGTNKVETMPQPSSTEMVHTSARTGYLKLKANGQILSTYAWFPRKDLAEAWFDWLDGMSLGLPELRLSQRNSSWKYEIKLTSLSMTQVERLASEDLSRKPSKKKDTPSSQAAGIEPPSGWRQPQLQENPSQLFAKVLLKDSEHYGQIFPVSLVSDNEIGYTVTLPNGDNRWYRADMVQIVDAEIEENALPTEPAIEFNDVVEIVADGNDTVGLVGTFGRVKIVKSDRIGVEVDEQLVYFNKTELKLKVKAQAPTHQRSCPPPADMSLSDREATYLQTNGNYTGLAKQTRQRWEQAGIDPSDLIADMKTKRPAEPLWDAAKYNPVLALVGADDASDF